MVRFHIDIVIVCRSALFKMTHTEFHIDHRFDMKYSCISNSWIVFLVDYFVQGPHIHLKYDYNCCCSVVKCLAHARSLFTVTAYFTLLPIGLHTPKKQKSQMQMKYILHVVTHSIISVTNFCRSASQARQHAHTCDPQRATLCQPQLTTLCEYSSCRNLPRESVRQARTAQMFIFVSSMSQICVFFPFYFLCKSLNGRGLRKRGISLANHTHARAKKKRRKANTKYCLIEHTFLSIVRSSILRFAYVGPKNIARNRVYVCVVNI